MRYICVRFLVFVSVILLSSCTKYELERICSQPVGSASVGCCAIGLLEIQTEKFLPRDYACASDIEACEKLTTVTYPAQSFNFTPDGDDYKDNIQFNDGCSETKWKEVKTSPFADAVSEYVLSSKLDFTRSDEVLDCQVACNYDFPNIPATGNPDSCPGIKVENSVAGSLFLFYSSLDPKAYPDKVTSVPMSSIHEKFGVSKEDREACPRSDVTIERSGIVRNDGVACESVASFSTEFGEEYSVLSIGESLLGEFSDSTADSMSVTYPEGETSFAFQFENTGLDYAFGGPILQSGMLHSSAIAQIENRQGEKICVRANPDLSVSSSDDIVLFNTDSDRLYSAMKEVLTAVSEFSDTGQSDERGEPYPRIAETISALPKSSRNAVLANIKAVSKFEEDSVNSLVHWMDAALCNSYIEVDGEINYDFLQAYEATYLRGGDREERDVAHTKLLRCISSDAHVSDNFLTALNRLSE